MATLIFLLSISVHSHGKTLDVRGDYLRTCYSTMVEMQREQGVDKNEQAIAFRGKICEGLSARNEKFGFWTRDSIAKSPAYSGCAHAVGEVFSKETESVQDSLTLRYCKPWLGDLAKAS